MACQKCKGERVASAGGKCSDMSHWHGDGYEHDGYVMQGVGIGGGDYIEFAYCLDCGQMQGEFPVSAAAIEELCGE
jgi:hypothetical protein